MTKDQYITDQKEIFSVLSKLDGYACIFGSYNAGRNKAVIDLDPPEQGGDSLNYYELHLSGVDELHLYNKDWIAKDVVIEKTTHSEYLYRLVQSNNGSKTLEVTFTEFALKQLEV